MLVIWVTKSCAKLGLFEFYGNLLDVGCWWRVSLYDSMLEPAILDLLAASRAHSRNGTFLEL